MGEISEPSEPPQLDSGSSEAGLSQFDPKTMRNTKPGLKRLILTISVFSSFLLGLPFLWKTVEIYRAPLPFKDIDALSYHIESSPLQFPCTFRVLFFGFDSIASRAEQLKSSILDEMTKLSSKSSLYGSCSNNYAVSVVIESGSECSQTRTDASSCPWRCGALSASDFAASLENGFQSADDFLEVALGGCSKPASGVRVYSVVVMNKGENVVATIGKYRHGWIVGRVSEADATAKVAETFVKLFGNGGTEGGLIPGEFMPVGADGKIFLSFNLLNADPDDWIYDWDFQKVDEVILKPLIEELAPIANVSVESQVLYHTPTSSFSYWDNKQESYIFNTKDLPFFVNSNEWHLDTSIAAGGRSKILHFVVYVPSARECPLLLELPDGQISETNGFISPTWGGVIVWNPKGCLRDHESKQLRRHMISNPELEKIVEVFLGQFRQLFGLKSNPQHVGLSGTFNILTSQKGFTEWEMDFLSRQHSCFNLHSCASSLGSLSRLVQSLPRMIIIDEIGKQVGEYITKLQKFLLYLSRGPLGRLFPQKDLVYSKIINVCDGSNTSPLKGLCISNELETILKNEAII
ncbi:GPI transamidase component PIG-S [Cucumis melo var. makuwa]|uniref:GPI transamidase component PIG-S n=1 Tax=Cucumis melo var. makuwa TaxID=1194695 RepID=A0A5D3BZM6_CUCMM|nr:GPI transamidase component PIG-S [Cucumis melo var. makuwa]TYK04580.1 GPI transamidase component PIG-S [Cucumis melo var. makuwa]